MGEQLDWQLRIISLIPPFQRMHIAKEFCKQHRDAVVNIENSLYKLGLYMSLRLIPDKATGSVAYNQELITRDNIIFMHNDAFHDGEVEYFTDHPDALISVLRQKTQRFLLDCNNEIYANSKSA